MTVEPAPESPPDPTQVVVVNTPAPPAPPAPPEASVAAPHEHAEHGELRALCEALRADVEALRTSMVVPAVEPAETEIVNPPAPEPVPETSEEAFGAGVIF